MSLNLKSDPAVSEVFDNYPGHIKPKMMALRQLIFEAAEELSLDLVDETLKWGEPSYIAKKGSTIRMDWKPKQPDRYAIYFKCTSKLVPTFKQLFWDDFKFEGDRAMVFDLDEKLPSHELKKCIKAALTYHQVKHLPDLNIK